jgi:Spy/CpxP family protein refolding chaperone
MNSHRQLFLKAACVIASVGAGLGVVNLLHGQDAAKKPTVTKADEKKADEKPAAVAADNSEPDKPTGRLPNNFGKLNLTDEQKTKIYQLQDDYGPKIADLIKQVEQLRIDRDKAIEGVLTAEQKSKLKDLQAATAQKSAAKKKPTAPAAATPAKE